MGLLGSPVALQSLWSSWARSYRETAALVGLAKLRETWTDIIKPEACVHRGAAQEQLLRQPLLFAMYADSPDGVSSLHEIMVGKTPFSCLKNGLALGYRGGNSFKL